jgi:hypothetical protein
MSLLTMASVAISRDIAGHGEPLAKDATAAKTRIAAAADQGIGQPGAGAPATAPPAGVASFGQLLVGQIPSEALIAYTTLVALFSASGATYATGLWVVYGAAIVVCAAAVLGSYFAQRDYDFADATTPSTAGERPAPPTALPGAAGPVPMAPPASGSTPTAGPGSVRRLHLPFLPTITAMLSMAIYGLTVPGSPLQSEVSGTAFGIWSGCLAVGGGVLMSIFAPFLGKGNNAQPVAKQR